MATSGAHRCPGPAALGVLVLVWKTGVPLWCQLLHYAYVWLRERSRARALFDFKQYQKGFIALFLFRFVSVVLQPTTRPLWCWPLMMTSSVCLAATRKSR